MILFATAGVAALVACVVLFFPSAPTTVSAAVPAPAPAAPAPAAPMPPVPVPPGEALRTDIESLDATIQAGLEELAKATADFAADRKKWEALDRSMASARAVNAALLTRNKAVVALYDAKLEGPLNRFRTRLREAPAAYRELAEERRRLAAGATLDVERKNYLAMVEACRAAAVLCERRSEELFGEPAADAGNGGRRTNATNLRRTIENMKKLQPMHQKWEETFNAYPSVLETAGLSNWFEALSLYGEDLDTFTKNVDGLKDAMKKKTAPPLQAPKAVEE